MKKNRYGANPVVVTHSMGGLVTRAYIQGLAVDKNNTPIPYGDDIDGLLMISPPNFGSELAARFASGRLKDLVINLIGTYLLKQNRKALAYQDMSPGSNFLWNLNYGFKGLPVDVKPWVITGNQHITINGFHLLHCESDIGQHDGAVAISSTSLWGAKIAVPISIVELNHLDQIKSSTNLIQEYLLKGSLQMAQVNQFPFGVLIIKVKRNYTGKVFLKCVSDGNTLELKRNKQSGIYYHLSVPAGKYLIHRDGDREVKEIEIESLKATLVEY